MELYLQLKLIPIFFPCQMRKSENEKEIVQKSYFVILVNRTSAVLKKTTSETSGE